MREAQFLEQVTNSQKGQHAAILPFNYVEIYISQNVGMWADISACSHRGQEGWEGFPVLQFPVCCCWRTTGQHPPHTQRALHFSLSDERIPSVTAAFHSHAGLHLYRPLERCKGNSPPVFSHTDPDVARGVGNSVLRFHHEKHW